MNEAWIRKAAALPARQLHLIGGGLLLVAGAVLWFHALRAPLTALRAVRAEQAQLTLAVSDPALLRAQLAALDADTAALGKRLGGAAQPAQGLVRLVGELGDLARRQGIALHGVTPAPDEMALAFTQRGFDADVSGSYAGLLAWMGAIERAQPNLSIAGFEMHAGDTPGQVSMKIRIAAYQTEESQP